MLTFFILGDSLLNECNHVIPKNNYQVHDNKLTSLMLHLSFGYWQKLDVVFLLDKICLPVQLKLYLLAICTHFIFKTLFLNNSTEPHNNLIFPPAAIFQCTQRNSAHTLLHWAVSHRQHLMDSDRLDLQHDGEAKQLKTLQIHWDMKWWPSPPALHLHHALWLIPSCYAKHFAARLQNISSAKGYS